MLGGSRPVEPTTLSPTAGLGASSRDDGGREAPQSGEDQQRDDRPVTRPDRSRSGAQHEETHGERGGGGGEEVGPRRVAHAGNVGPALSLHSPTSPLVRLVSSVVPTEGAEEWRVGAGRELLPPQAYQGERDSLQKGAATTNAPDPSTRQGPAQDLGNPEPFTSEVQPVASMRAAQIPPTQAVRRKRWRSSAVGGRGGRAPGVAGPRNTIARSNAFTAISAR